MEQELNQKIDKKIDDLALAVKKGFDEMGERFNGIDRRFDENSREHKIIHQRLEDIELRLSNVAYRFELEDLEKRVKNVETKLNLT